MAPTLRRDSRPSNPVDVQVQTNTYTLHAVMDMLKGMQAMQNTMLQALDTLKTTTNMSVIPCTSESKHETMSISTNTIEPQPPNLINTNDLRSSSLPRGEHKSIRSLNSDSNLLHQHAKRNEMAEQGTLTGIPHTTTDYTAPTDFIHDSFDKSSRDIVSDNSLKEKLRYDLYNKSSADDSDEIYGSHHKSKIKRTNKSRRKHKKLHKQFERLLQKSFSNDSSDDETFQSFIPKYRNSDLIGYRNDAILKDRSNPLQWLMNYQRFSDTRGLSGKQHRTLLPLLFNHKDKSFITQWFRSLPKNTLKNTLSLERAFVAKFASDEVIHMGNEIQYSFKPSSMKCEEWLMNLFEKRDLLQKWSVENVASEHFFMKTLPKRFKNSQMEQLFCGIEAGKSNERIYTRPELLTLCEQVDKWDRPRGGEEKKTRADYSLREGSSNESFKSGLSIQSIVQTGIFSDDEDAVTDDQILNYFISENLIGNNIDPTPTRVNGVSARGAQIPKPISTQHESEFKHFVM